jgi:hypothetical protein
MLSALDVRELLDYDQSTGVFRWKYTMGGSAKAGTVAGSTDSKGYRQIKVNGRLYLAHRLAWLYVHGESPAGDLDHIDRNPSNNAIANLRPCTHAENHQNTGLRSDSSSGVTGVSFVKSSGKWLAYINVNGKRVRLGLFGTIEEASAARAKAKAEHHTFGAERGVEFSEMEAA